MPEYNTSDESESEGQELVQPTIRIRRLNHNTQELNNNRAEIGNNGHAVPGTVPESASPASDSDAAREIGFPAFSPVASFLVLFQLILYQFSDRFGIKSEEDILISWEKVVEERQVWRIFVAHFYHSGRCHVFLNLITLLTMGRYLEKKIKPWPMLLLIEVMGIVSNMFYMLISTYACSHPDHITTYGFSHIHYGIRILLAFTQDPRNYEPNLFLGLYPVYLSIAWAPWQPLLESAMLKLVVEEINVCGNFAGILTGYFTAFTLYCLPFHWSLRNQNTISNPFNVAFALKMVQIFSKDACNNKGPSLILGFYPVFLPTWLAPWEPFIENVCCDMILKDHCIARHISGILAGLIFPICDNYFHDIIVVPSNSCLCSSPSSSGTTTQAEKETEVSGHEATDESDAMIVRLNQISMENICCDSKISSSRICASPGVERLGVNQDENSSSVYFRDNLPGISLKTSTSYNPTVPAQAIPTESAHQLTTKSHSHSHFE